MKAVRRDLEGIEFAPVPRLALTVAETAGALGMGCKDSVERYVLPHVKALRFGKHVLIPVAELERFAREHAERTLP